MSNAAQQQLFADLEALHRQLKEVAVGMERDRSETGRKGETIASNLTTEKLG